jgi:hypothetical protein
MVKMNDTPTPRIKLFHICKHCNKEYELALFRNYGIGHTFSDCPHCGKRDDVWVRVETNHEQLERELADAKEKLAYVDKMGLRFGMMETTDKPEPCLAHVWSEESDFMRIFNEWSDSIGHEARLERVEEKLTEVTKQRDALAEALESLCTAIISGHPREITGLLKQSGLALAATKGQKT